jgi:hypothetical protein
LRPTGMTVCWELTSIFKTPNTKDSSESPRIVLCGASSGPSLIHPPPTCMEHEAEASNLVVTIAIVAVSIPSWAGVTAFSRK